MASKTTIKANVIGLQDPGHPNPGLGLGLPQRGDGHAALGMADLFFAATAEFQKRETAELDGRNHGRE